MESSIKFGAIVPASGFRWIRCEDDGQWRLWDASDDWPASEYEAENPDSDGSEKQAELSDRTYIAAGRRECLEVHEKMQSDFGPLVYEPELYLRFASEKPTPVTIKRMANQYGLLNHARAWLRIEKHKAKELLPYFPDDAPKGSESILVLKAEKASAWITRHELVKSMIFTANKFMTEEDYSGMSSFLINSYNHDLGGSLTFQVSMNPQTGAALSTVIATSLKDALDVQWGMSIAGGALHRQCRECSTWFEIHPQSGRPEKTYCSDACRMRAYRKRKSDQERTVR